MPESSSITIVVPTRDHAENCRKVLHQLVEQGEVPGMGVRVVFLVNDTNAKESTGLREAIADERFAKLNPLLLYARQNWPTVEENIRHTLGEHIDQVDEHFLIVGNSDLVNLRALQEARLYQMEHALDLLLIGVLNREMHDGKTMRQMYSTPRHLSGKNRLPGEKTHGKDVYADAIRDYGPVDYLAYIGCQIYTKRFFEAMSRGQTRLAEAVYSIPLACLELAAEGEWRFGFYPEVVAVRVDHLQYGPNAADQPPDWWVVRQRTDRGLSPHLLLAVLSTSLQLSAKTFEVLVNAQTVAVARGVPQYVFSNLLYLLVQQISAYVGQAPADASLRYSSGELADIVAFGERLGAVELGMPAEQQRLMGAWLQQFVRAGDFSEPGRIQELLSPAATILSWLDGRPQMERWIAQLL
jgi:hypothetical protein